MDFKWDGMDFETLEVFVFRLVLLIVRHALGRILEEMDKYLAVVRDKTRYVSEEIEERVGDIDSTNASEFIRWVPLRFVLGVGHC